MGKEKIEQASAGDRIADFMQKYRKFLLALVILIVCGIAFSAAFFSIRGVMEKKAIAKVEVFERRMNELGPIGDSDDAIGETAQSKDVDALLDEINAFAPSTFGYAASRAFSLAADIYFSRGEWGKAEEAWAASARKAPKIYLAPLSLFNAAVAAEEQGSLEIAIDYYRQSIDFPGINPASARSRFNIGRIYEAQQDKTKAAEAYMELIEKNPNSPWANLAQNRIIILEKK